MILEQLQEQNPHLTPYAVEDGRFRPYGRILSGYGIREYEAYVKDSFEVPASGSLYLPSLPELCGMRVTQRLSREVYGGLETQAGICAGRNKVLNGVEYHQGSETVAALTDCVLFVGKKTDMLGETYDGSLAECFFVRKGCVVELYDTTLHYCPCNTDSRFITVVVLLKGTNTLLESPSGLLTKKNKWFLTHKSVEAKVKAGCIAGLLGEINFIN